MTVLSAEASTDWISVAAFFSCVVAFTWRTRSKGMSSTP
jgi:hypothetical protein